MSGQALPILARAAYQALRRDFAAARIVTADIDAALLLEWATGLDRLSVLTHPESSLGDGERDKLAAARDERLSGRPVHRIIGRRAFFGLEFGLSEGTLEPRPDTECVVELALEGLADRHGAALSILDLGTGSGILAISLLSRLGSARALAVDVAQDALVTATRNAEINGVANRFHALRSDWFESVQGKFDLVISNPPYIRSADISGLSREVRNHDPVAALDGGADGLAAYRQIASRASSFLEVGGLMVLEIGFEQAESVIGIFECSGFRFLRIAKDLGGVDRGMLFALLG